MIQTTTTNPLHFEDLEPRMFENIYTNILIASDEYKDIKTYGIKGSDEGIDIFCIEFASTVFQKEKGFSDEEMDDLRILGQNTIKFANEKDETPKVIAPVKIAHFTNLFIIIILL
mgnify:CR=1 FL=1